MPPSEQARWFAEEVKPYEPALRAYLLKRFPTLPDHEDLVQETYVRLLRARESGRLTYARAFLFTVLRNVAIDVFRRRLVVTETPMGAERAHALVDDAPDASAALELSQRRQMLAQAVAGLPERCRQVMILRFLHGRSHKEIAAELGVSLDTIKTHILRGTRDCAEFFRRNGMLEASVPGSRITATSTHES